MTTQTIVFTETQPGKIRNNAFPADSEESTDLERLMANRSSDVIKEHVAKKCDFTNNKTKE